MVARIQTEERYSVLLEDIRIGKHDKLIGLLIVFVDVENILNRDLYRRFAICFDGHLKWRVSAGKRFAHNVYLELPTVGQLKSKQIVGSDCYSRALSASPKAKND